MSRLLTTAHQSGWLARVGLTGILFFTAKGLLWLIVPYLLSHYI